MVQGYCTEEAVEWALNYADPSNSIGVPMSHHEGRLTEKGTIGKKAITPYPNSLAGSGIKFLNHQILK
jgi:hypothetical protein